MEEMDEISTDEQIIFRCQSPNAELMRKLTLDKACRMRYNHYNMRVKAVLKYIHQCQQCGHEWETEKEMPRQCSKCWSRRWNRPHSLRKQKKTND